MPNFREVKTFYSKFLKLFDQLNDAVTYNDYRGRETLISKIQMLNSASKYYTINCTGDVCQGDTIVFIKKVWGSRKRLSHYELVQGLVVKDSYGASKQQHTFTLQTAKGSLRAKGRTIYDVGVWRRPWKDERMRDQALDEKHERGDRAREQRDRRRNEFLENGPSWAHYAEVALNNQ